MTHTISILATQTFYPASQDKWSGFSDEFRTDRYEWSPEGLLWWTLALGGIAFGVWLVWRLIAWQTSGRLVRPFKELALAHRLDRHERTHCRELARAEGWSDPAEVFVRAAAEAPLAARDAGLARRLLGEG